VKKNTGYFLNIDCDTMQYLTDIGDGEPEAGIVVLIKERESVLQFMERHNITKFINIASVAKTLLGGLVNEARKK